MVDVKVRAGSTNSPKPVVSSSIANSGQAEAVQTPSTAADMQALGRLISGGLDKVTDDTGAVLAMGPGALLLWPLRTLLEATGAAESWRRAYYERSVSSVPLPDGILPSELNPLLVTGDGELLTFRNEFAIDRLIRRRNAYWLHQINSREHSVPSGLTPEEKDLFERSGHEWESRTVALPDGRTIKEYTIELAWAEGEFEATAERWTADGSTRSGESVPEFTKRAVVYLFDGKTGDPLAIQVRENNGYGAPVMEAVWEEGPKGSPSTLRILSAEEMNAPRTGRSANAFEDVRRGDAFEKNITRVASTVDPFRQLPEQAAREIAERTIVGWLELSDAEKLRYLGAELGNLDRLISEGEEVYRSGGCPNCREVLDPKEVRRAGVHNAKIRLAVQMGFHPRDIERIFIDGDAISLNPDVVRFADAPPMRFVYEFGERADVVAYVNKAKAMAERADTDSKRGREQFERALGKEAGRVLGR